MKRGSSVVAQGMAHGRNGLHRQGDESGTQLVVFRVMGREVVVALTNGLLDLRTQERVSCGESDGR